MKYLILLVTSVFIAVFLVACGSSGPNAIIIERPGKDGTNGHSTVFSMLKASGATTLVMALDINDNQILDSEDTNMRSVEILDGVDGENPVTSNYTPVALYDVCGDHPSVVDEILLRLHNGSLIALYTANMNGDYPRLSIIGPGNYMTTDSSNCRFTVDANNNITNEHY